MIIASKGHVRMKGNKSDLMAEFVSIADTFINEVGITPGILKVAIDIAVVNSMEEDKSNDHRED